MKLNNFFEANKEYGIISLRMVIASRLIAALWDSIVNWQEMAEVNFFCRIMDAFPAWVILAAPVSFCSREQKNFQMDRAFRKKQNSL